jgi:hypothetical protein
MSATLSKELREKYNVRWKNTQAIDLDTPQAKWILA